LDEIWYPYIAVVCLVSHLQNPTSLTVTMMVKMIPLQKIQQSQQICLILIDILNHWKKIMQQYF